MRKISKAVKRAIEAGATFTLTRREYVAKPRLRTCQKKTAKRSFATTNRGLRTPWAQEKSGHDAQTRRQARAGWGLTSL